MKITLKKGDITEISCDAIVNAANNGLWGGGNEEELLKNCYLNSLLLAEKLGIKSRLFQISAFSHKQSVTEPTESQSHPSVSVENLSGMQVVLKR